MKAHIFHFLLFTFTFQMAGCATIVSQSDYPVHITHKNNADVTIFNRSNSIVYSGPTPAYITLPAGAGFLKKARYRVIFSENSQDIEATILDASLDPWIFGNIIFGGLIGLIVDPATGAMWKLENSIGGGASISPSRGSNSYIYDNYNGF